MAGGFMGLFGMGMPGMQNAMCGGTVDNSDPKAPKVFESKNIIEFDVHCGCYNRIFSSGFEFVDFSVKRESEGGQFILTARGYKLETDKEFLDRIQEVIDKNKLTSYNGVARYTQGLPPEYQPYNLTAVYDTGERLHFYIKGEPHSDWCLGLRKVLCNELVRHGIEDMLPPREDLNVRRFDLDFQEWPLKTEYATITMGDDIPGERPVHFFRNVWNYETNQSEGFVCIRIPDDFYARITELAEQTELREYSNGQIEPFEREKSPFGKEGIPVIGFCCEGESGKQFNTFLSGDDIPQGLKEAAAVIREYLESVFATAEVVQRR
jgi:hypothetical protein